MRMSDLIVKKRDGQALTTEEIRYMIDGYSRGEIPDYQMSAMMMAIYFRGMDRRETLDLTMALCLQVCTEAQHLCYSGKKHGLYFR